MSDRRAAVAIARPLVEGGGTTPPRLYVTPESRPASASPFDALAAVARAIGESLELRQVFARIAEAARMAVPFERMRIIRIEGEALRMYATEQDGAPGWENGRLVPIADLSPRFWREFVVERIDTQRDLDPAYPWDRETLEAGHRSILRASLRSGGRRVGILGFGSRQPDAFTAEHENVALALAELLAAALEHERMWSEEHRRRQRSDALESLLPTLAGSLDIRETFQQLSRVSQDVIPHDFVGLGFLSPDKKSFPVYAISGARSTTCRHRRRSPIACARSSAAT